MTSTYIDAISYQKAGTGISLIALAGNIGRIQACAVGATSLTLVAPLTVALNQYDAFYLTDGPNSEELQIGSGGAAIGTTSVPLQGATKDAHPGGTPYCTDGGRGSLGQAIFAASSWIEDFCNQPLWSTTYTGEILTMPTMRASIDNRGNLHFRPRHFPITALAGISIKTSQNFENTLDPAQAIIDADQQTVDLPMVSLPGQSNAQVYSWMPISRQQPAWLTLEYTAGFPLGQLPWAITRAATLAISSNFIQLENPVGASEIQQGKRRVSFALQRDLEGESMLFKEATRLLRPYIAQPF